MTFAARVSAIRTGFEARFAALPAGRQERIQDTGLAVALAGINVVSIMPARSHLHPFWLALLLVVGQALPLIWRRSRPVGVGLVIGAARIAYDRIGFGSAPIPLGPAIAFYTVIDRRGPVWRWLAIALVAVGLTVSESRPGTTQPYDAIFQAMLFLTALVAGTLSRAKRASLQAAEGRAERAEAELDRQASRAAAAERTRIARELHDVVAHHVSLMAVQSEAAASLLPEHPAEARRSVDVIGQTARQALTELRRLLGVLRGPAEPLDMAPAASLADLDEVLAKVRAAGLPVDFDIAGPPCALAPGVELTAFRIVQEALTNTLRHADAAKAVVRVCYEPGFVTLSIADSGSRLNTRAPGDNGGRPAGRALDMTDTGFGLAGIAERVASCGGNLTVGPTAAGFELTARLPTQ
jgi:signal transduction histidine kinase